MLADLDVERLKKITGELIDAITSPEFIEQVRMVRTAPENERLAEASRRLSVDALRAAGVKLPTDMRVSNRYFEESFGTPIEFGDYPNSRPNIINELNKAQPGFLDQLRQTNPDVFNNLVTLGRSTNEIELGTSLPDVLSWGGCAGAGGLTFCGCGGFST